MAKQRGRVARVPLAACVSSSSKLIKNASKFRGFKSKHLADRTHWTMLWVNSWLVLLAGSQLSPCSCSTFNYIFNYCLSYWTSKTTYPVASRTDDKVMGSNPTKNDDFSLL